jgi:hypothetical protein
MCDYDCVDGERRMIDQGLYEPARRIERTLPGDHAADAAWDVFFGRSGGAVVWAHFCRIKTSYARAAAMAHISPAFRRKPPTRSIRCEVDG